MSGEQVCFAFIVFLVSWRSQENQLAFIFYPAVKRDFQFQ